MALVTAPLLSISARGKFAKTMVASVWKGLNTMRQYVIPANPRTADQVTQRNLFSAAVAAWRNYVTAATERTAWDRTALVGAAPMSGFNSFMSSAAKIMATDPDASYANGAVAATGETADFTMINVDDGGTGDEAGDFEVWAGDSPSSLLLVGTDTITAGVVQTPDLGDVDDIKYVKTRKGGQDRSGIHKVTLIA